MNNKNSVLALDPFAISEHPTPAQKQWAEWFVSITEDVTGVYHIRRIHYRTLGKSKPDGSPYENTNSDAKMLGRASEYARYLGLVDFDLIEDHKNPGVVVRTGYYEDTAITTFNPTPRSFGFSTIDRELEIFDYAYGDMVSFQVQTRQPYHLEIWIEKSTLNDVLIPVAKKFGATLVVATGQFSVTNVKDLFSRIKDLGKPVRIFYLSDFDPAGNSMPVAVGRKLEWFVRTRKPDLDVCLMDIALKENQCLEYELPRMPMDRSDKYKGNFEAKYGEGATELDAIEALYPGLLGKLLFNAIKTYYDSDLESQIQELTWSEALRSKENKKQYLRDIVSKCPPELSSLIEQYNTLVNEATKITSEIRQIARNALNAVAQYEFSLKMPEKSSRVVEDRHCNFVLDSRLSPEDQLLSYERSKNRRSK